MSYTRCDINCQPVATQPAKVDVTQKESCLTYSNWNGDYEKRNVDNQLVTNVVMGWNQYYIPVTPGKATSEQTVTQSVYLPTDVNCDPLPIVCHQETDVNNDPVIVAGVYTETGLYLVTQSGTPDYPDLVIIPELGTTL